MQNESYILIEGQIMKVVLIEIDLFKSYMIFMLNVCLPKCAHVVCMNKLCESTTDFNCF